jgi:EmrB/QacA subfamily drug resistance transporter
LGRLHGGRGHPDGGGGARPGPAEVATSPPHRTLALLALTLGVFFVTINVTIVVVALPSLEVDLDASRSEAAWVIDAYNLVGASLLLSAGYFADRFGRKRALCVGYVLFIVGAALCAVAPSAGWLIAFRVLQGLGGTALTPTSLAIVANLYPEPRERARAIGIWGVTAGVGTGLGPVIGGAIVDWFDWRAVFAVNAVGAVGALAIVLRFVPRSRSPVARRLDVPGQLLAATFLATLTYALIEAPTYGWSSPRIAGLLALDVVLAVAFIVVERRTWQPLVDLTVFRDRQFSGAVAITVTVFFVFSAFIFENARYLQEARGYSALEAGILTLPAALPSLIGGPIAGRLVANRGARGVLSAGVGVMGLGMAFLAALPGDVDLTWLIAAETLLGIGYAVVNAPISTVAVGSMPRQRAGVAAAIASSARNVGLVLGIAVVGTAVASRLPDPPPQGAALADALGDALHFGYGIAAVLALAAAVVGLLTLRSEPPTDVSG